MDNPRGASRPNREPPRISLIDRRDREIDRDFALFLGTTPAYT